MKIEFYNNKSVPERLNKTIYKQFELEGTLRNECSVLVPHILIEFNPIMEYVIIDEGNTHKYVADDNNTRIVYGSEMDNELLKCNYVYIPDFERYYYIENLITVNTNLWEISLSVDVLMSYKDDILNQSAFITRCSSRNYYNQNFIDNKYPVLSEPKYTKVPITINITADTPLFTPIQSADAFNSHRIVMTIAGDIRYPAEEGYPSGYSLGTNVIYAITPDQFNNFAVYILNGTATLGEGLIEALIHFPALFENAGDAIIDIQVFPFSVLNMIPLYFQDYDGTLYQYWDKVHGIRLGNFTANDFSAYILRPWIDRIPSKKSEKIMIPFNNSFLDFNSYREYEIYLPYYGFKEINSSKLLLLRESSDYELYLEFSLDIPKGLGLYSLYIYNKVDESKIYIFTEEFPVSMHIPITHSNAASSLLSTGISAIFSVLSKGMGSFKVQQGEVTTTEETNLSYRKGKVAKVIRTESSQSGGEEVWDGKKFASGVSENLAHIISSVHGSMNTECSFEGVSYNNCFLEQEPYIIIRDLQSSLTSINQKEEYAYHIGVPCQQYIKLSNIIGYIEVGAINLTNFNKSPTREELDDIESVLRKGFYIL